MKKVLFNALVFLTIVFIYMIFFPKKSYVQTKLDKELNPLIEETFSQNINSLKIAGETYFEKNGNKKITLKELKEKNLIVELKDSTGNTCSDSSYVEKTGDKITVKLECKEKTDEITVYNNQEKFLCIYQYEKRIDASYTNWSEWSAWSTNEVKKDELTNVETKIEKELDGTEIISKTKEVTQNAEENTKYYCPEGYDVYNGKCKKKEKNSTINASLSLECPEGYSRTQTICQKGNNKKEATKKYYCPSNRDNIEFELSGDKCNAFTVKYVEVLKQEKYYTCPNGYRIKDKSCYKSEEYKEEQNKYKEVKYYRYQTRKKENEKIDIKWSTDNDKELLKEKYNKVGKVTCEF